MRGQHLVEPLFPHHAQIRENATELAAGALLLRERRLQLLVSDDLLVEKNLAQPDFAAACRLVHGSVRGDPGGG